MTIWAPTTQAFRQIGWGEETYAPARIFFGKADRRYAGVTHIDVADFDASQAKQVQNTNKEYGLEISSLGYYPNPLHPDPDHRAMVIEHLKKVIRAAELINVPIVGTYIGRDKNKTLEENWVEFEKVWPSKVRFAGEHNVEIAIENCPMIFSNDEWPGGNHLAISPSIWRKMFEIIPDRNFGLNLDPSHLIWQFIDYVRVVYEFKDRLFHIHAKDLRIDLSFTTLTRMADNLLLYKYIIKNVARENGKTVTFMPKPLYGDNGSGMHVHSSLWKGDTNVFYGEGGYAGLSDTARYYIGGILKHAPALLALTSPTTNSYRRLVPGYEAPVNIAYSQRNRSAICRIPATHSPRAKRDEFRAPDPTCNPYLAFSAILMARLDGVCNRIDPGEARDVDLYELTAREKKKIKQVPSSLSEVARR